jgi:hypothetical protein
MVAEDNGIPVKTGGEEVGASGVVRGIGNGGAGVGRQAVSSMQIRQTRMNAKPDFLNPPDEG